MTATSDFAPAEAAARAARREIEAPGYRGDYFGHAQLVAMQVAEGRPAAWVKLLCLRVVGVSVSSRRAALRELAAWMNETPRARDSQRV
jgi:hypothetical protein